MTEVTYTDVGGAKWLFEQPRYYGPDGQPGDREYRFEDIEERRVARTDGLYWRGRPAVVSTVLMACAWVSSDGPEHDLPFSTVVIVSGRDKPAMELRLATRAEAEETHDGLVRMLRVAHQRRKGRIRTAVVRRRWRRR